MGSALALGELGEGLLLVGIFFVAVLVFFEGTPAGRGDDFAGGAELCLAGAGEDGGGVDDAVGVEGGDEAHGDEVVHEALVADEG